MRSCFLCFFSSGFPDCFPPCQGLLGLFVSSHSRGFTSSTLETLCSFDILCSYTCVAIFVLCFLFIAKLVWHALKRQQELYKEWVHTRFMFSVYTKYFHFDIWAPKVSIFSSFTKLLCAWVMFSEMLSLKPKAKVECLQILMGIFHVC